MNQHHKGRTVESTGRLAKITLNHHPPKLLSCPHANLETVTRMDDYKIDRDYTVCVDCGEILKEGRF